MDDQIPFSEIEEAIDGSRCEFLARSLEGGSPEQLIDGQDVGTLTGNFKPAAQNPDDQSQPP